MALQATKNNKKDYSRMQDMLIELKQAVQDHLQSGDVSPRLHRNTEALEGVVSKISQFLETQSQRKYFMRFMTAKSTADSLDDCEKDLEHALSLFQVRSCYSRPDGMQFLIFSTSVSFKCGNGCCHYTARYEG